MPFMTFAGDHDFALANAFARRAILGGVYLHPRHNWFVSGAMDEADVDDVLAVTDGAFDEAALPGACRPVAGHARPSGRGKRRRRRRRCPWLRRRHSTGLSIRSAKSRRPRHRRPRPEGRSVVTAVAQWRRRVPATSDNGDLAERRAVP